MNAMKWVCAHLFPHSLDDHYFIYHSGYVQHQKCTEGYYSGQLCNDEKCGQGELIYSNGDTYKGSFMNNQKEGKGILKYNNGDLYEGTFWHDEPYGDGSYLYHNGDRIDIENDGQNKVMYFANGDIYRGEWNQNEFEGLGVYVYEDGTVYEGEFKKGMKEGNGTLYYNNNDVFEGIWVKNKRMGRGIYKIYKYRYCRFLTNYLCRSNYYIIEGDWYDDHCISILHSDLHESNEKLLKRINHQVVESKVRKYMLTLILWLIAMFFLYFFVTLYSYKERMNVFSFESINALFGQFLLVSCLGFVVCLCLC